MPVLDELYSTAQTGILVREVQEVVTSQVFSCLREDAQTAREDLVNALPDEHIDALAAYASFDAAAEAIGPYLYERRSEKGPFVRVLRTCFDMPMAEFFRAHVPYGGELHARIVARTARSPETCTVPSPVQARHRGMSTGTNPGRVTPNEAETGRAPIDGSGAPRSRRTPAARPPAPRRARRGSWKTTTPRDARPCGPSRTGRARRGQRGAASGAGIGGTVPAWTPEMIQTRNDEHEEIEPARLPVGKAELARRTGCRPDRLIDVRLLKGDGRIKAP